MGYQIRTSSDGSKTCWTPTMERYFIDLMLDHMHRGNRVGYTFNKQAWTDMLTVFTEKFGSPYDKDALKNRYTLLWKQFSDIKSLLYQSGFSWDDTQQMVVADDDVWDACIKAYPDAQYYRNKAVMNFNDLCLIFAYTIADGRYSRSSHDIDFDDEILGVNIGEEKQTQSPMNSNFSRTCWTPQMDCYFMNLLLDQVQGGNKIECAIMTQAWNEMVSLFNAKFGSHFDKKVLKNRYKHLRQQYDDIKFLLDQKGFSWDETRKMITAEDYVWDSYAEAYPDAQVYKFKTMRSYHKLCIIYGEESSNGKPSRKAHDVYFNSEEDPVLVNDKDYSETDWTPSKERYLMDLLLEQVHKGYRIDRVFNKQVWLDIVPAFSARFGSQHDKNILRRRHKELKKLYNAMKNLLEQSEFSWDERRQMVTARGDVWDAYVKDHPGGQSLRTKGKPNYNDLCVLYGKSTVDEICSLANRYMEFNGDGRDIQALQNGKSGWTPPMDRYFIDLMLQQIRQGSMVDKKFSKQAWCDIVSKFNARFESQHHKDVLKSRFKILKNQFNDMKTLLDHTGFAWDERQQLITAKNDHWVTCVKENPDAQSYRSQTLLNYNDLFLIYGNSITNRVCDYSSYDVDDHILGVNIGKQDDHQSSVGNESNDCQRISWTKPMDRYFIDLMLDQVLEGNRIDHRFNKQSWVYMIASLSEKLGLECGSYIIENQYLNLMKQYIDITNLLNQNGFAWDETQQMVIADDDFWEAHIKEHPDAAVYKDEVLENYNDLSIIFDDIIQDGNLAAWDSKIDFDHNALEVQMDGIFDDRGFPARDIEIKNQRKKRRSSTPLTSTSSRKVQKSSSIEGGLQEEGENNKTGTNYSSIESIVDALQAIPDMDDELFLNACNLLEDEKNAKAFVKMDIAQRKNWLLRKLYS